MGNGDDWMPERLTDAQHAAWQGTLRRACMRSFMLAAALRSSCVGPPASPFAPFCSSSSAFL